ncbi:ABC transporter ATP-binding protein [Neorhizobium sp. JUb45]|uniref:ABC transporter ATP-binding protein n=1 Tax=Neorhizobium sp. JUb45 TaxID=2485113 RepID=UPI00104AECF6|nr:ABC transporter ATP-binding protein [Neorhizobium sp. JUb45]TCR03928.1 lipopolysaccharide transport system ATP-binding protein [Neorhizobium sp. JUb45]
MTVLTVSAVSKRYAAYKNNFQRFATWFGANIRPVSEYWANRDISFEVKAGEALALIGQNGAGKSTLLKMITGTIRPTTGHVTVSGRISAILELGLGFNPEFTGRQNIYHAGGLMGFSQEELSGLMPGIEDFAEIGEFFDQPIRVYSSGMQARLAFALATARRPDVLIVDEVLSVGDSYFQHKSFDRIRQFKEHGTSIILVTHSLGDVRALCNRVVLLDKGSIIKDGMPDEVLDYYNAMIAARENSSGRIDQNRDTNGWLRTSSGTHEAIITSIALVDRRTGAPARVVDTGQDLTFRVDIQIAGEISQVVLGLMLRDRTGHLVWGTNTARTNQAICSPQNNDRYRIDVDLQCLLGPGSYGLTAALTAADHHSQGNYEWTDNAFVFDVVNTSLPYFVGTAALPSTFTINRIE